MFYPLDEDCDAVTAPQGQTHITTESVGLLPQF
jgi:hypothetical protein